MVEHAQRRLEMIELPDAPCRSRRCTDQQGRIAHRKPVQKDRLDLHAPVDHRDVLGHLQRHAGELELLAGKCGVARNLFRREFELLNDLAPVCGAQFRWLRESGTRTGEQPCKHKKERLR